MSTAALVHQTGVRPVKATKLSTVTLVLPTFAELGLLGLMFPAVKTMEGLMTYGADYRPVVQLLDYPHSLFNSKGEINAFAWSPKDFAKKAKKPLTVKGEQDFAARVLLRGMKTPKERELVAGLLRLGLEILLVETPEEEREVIEVTQDLYNAGVTEIVNSWDNEAENPVVTALEIGDRLVVEGDIFYCIRKDVFEKTHRVNES